jgi:DNA-binding beta-propeller fold protein YncE
MSTRSEAVSEAGTLKQFFYNDQQSSSEEEGLEEETESKESKSKSEESDNQVEEHNNQVKEELTEGLKGLHLGEETESEEETESDNTKMSVNQGTGQAAGSQVLVPTNGQMGKSLVPDPGFLDGEQKRFSDWWRGMKLFLKFNKVDSPDMKITAIISQMRGGTAGNFATHWMDKVADMDDTMDWKAFEDSNALDAERDIKSKITITTQHTVVKSGSKWTIGSNARTS